MRWRPRDSAPRTGAPRRQVDYAPPMNLTTATFAARLSVAALAFALGCASSPSKTEDVASAGPVPTAGPTDRPAPTNLVKDCVCGTEPGCPPCAAPTSTASAKPPSDLGADKPLAWPPPNLTPPHERSKKDGDGVWTPLPVANLKAGETSPLYTTILRPHPIRNFVVVQFVAIDTTRLDLELILGTGEPEGTAMPKSKRPGLVASDRLSKLVAVLNGGFKKRHGQHGVGKDGEVAQEANADGCTFARLADGTFRIYPHTRMAPLLEGFRWWRQTPPCLLEDGKRNADTDNEFKAKKWGGAEDGKKEIRRSIIALGKDPRVLYFGIGDYINAPWLADGMVAAGFDNAAQLDINYSYTRFIMYQGSPEALTVSSPLLTDLKAPRNEYWKDASERDFFALTWR